MPAGIYTGSPVALFHDELCHWNAIHKNGIYVRCVVKSVELLWRSSGSGQDRQHESMGQEVRPLRAVTYRSLPAMVSAL